MVMILPIVYQLNRLNFTITIDGVPLVSIPITNEQPGIAARVAWTGTGEVVPNTSRLRFLFSRDSCRELGKWGLGDLGTWGFGDLGTWGLGDLGTWGLGDLGTWGLGDLGIWGLGE